MAFGKKNNTIELEEDEFDLIRKKQLKKKVLYIVLGLLAAFILGAVSAGFIIRSMGKKNLEAKAEVSHPTIETPETLAAPEEEKEQWQEGWIKYNDKIYSYNENLTTFLFMGIDKKSEIKEVSEGTNGGQADALFMLVIDPDKETFKIIGINRNTMCDVDIYNETGSYVNTITAQIAVQHGFGNGVEKSCEYQKKAVRKLFYDLPIHGYAAIDISAVPYINDAIGGVDVVALSNIKGDKKTASIKEGQKIHLLGDYAYKYVQYRDVNEFGSADIRLARQKQYLDAFIGQAKTAVKSDMGLVSQIYDAIQPYMTTDITFDEVAYIVPKVVGYSFDENSFYMMQGETVMGEEFEEFYPDEDKLYDMIIDVFYNEVDLNK